MKTIGYFLLLSAGFIVASAYATALDVEQCQMVPVRRLSAARVQIVGVVRDQAACRKRSRRSDEVLENNRN